jgi:hypothetical protein
MVTSRRKILEGSKYKYFHLECLEMAAQQGFQYEVNAANILKPLGFVPKSFVPAGAGHDQPDLMLEYNKKKAGCELKITAASAGSLVMKYDSKDKKNPWKFGDIKKDDDEKQFIADLAEEVGLFDIIKKQWKEIPFKRDKDLLWESTAGKLTNQQRYERDRDTFPDIRGEIAASKIEEYYNKKDTFYVNVGTHGFYLMGSKNPLKLKDVPMFGKSAKATYRARVQYKGGGNYQFTFEMQFSIPASKKSPFNIAPVDGKSVTIKKDQLNLSCFI